MAGRDAIVRAMTAAAERMGLSTPADRVALPSRQMSEVFAQDAYGGGGDPFDMAAGKTQRRYAATQRAVLPQGPNDVADTFRSVPRGMMAGAADAVAAAGQSAAIEGGDYSGQPSGAQGLAAIEANVTGPMHQPQTTGGEFGASIGHVLGNPANWVTGGSVPYAAGFNVFSGVGGEAARQLTKDTPFEPVAGLVGGWSPAAAERMLPLLAGRAVSRLGDIAEGVQ